MRRVTAKQNTAVQSLMKSYIKKVGLMETTNSQM